MKTLRGLSLFSGGGIAETYFVEAGIKMLVANELIPERAIFYRANHPQTEMICGDIRDPNVYSNVIGKAKAFKCNFLLATPPCQGMSTLGHKDYQNDARNFLIYDAVKAAQDLHPEFVLIENVPKFAKIRYSYEGHDCNVYELLQKIFGEKYIIEARVLNAKDYGVPQSRPRYIIKMFLKGLSWPWPVPQKEITLREAIGDLPSLEAGESSDLRWHVAPRISNPLVIEALKHTPEGESALKNPIYYPKKEDGTRIKGFHNTYTRMKWDAPCPARATNSQLVSGHNNVHPGHKLPNGTQSDARALTLRELIIVSSLPLDWNIPDGCNEGFLRQIIGEAIPPRLCYEIVKTIGEQ